MQTKTVFAYSRETGVYLGPLTLDESDMSPLEPGVWHIPGNCAEDAPPEAQDGKVIVRVDGEWHLVPAYIGEPPKEEPEAPPLLPPEPPPPTRDELVQRHLDAVARSFGYDDLVTAISYAEEPAVPKFQDEGRALRAWRSMVWAAVHEMPSDLADDGVVAALPEFKMPATAKRSKRKA